MGRPVYQHELGDPDFCWLISNFQENFPNYNCAESGTLPVVFIKTTEVRTLPLPEDFNFARTREDPKALGKADAEE